MTGREMTSEAVCPGSIQVTRDGQCIVLGVDGQTIGGYPKIAQVIQADLDALGQLRPGQRVRFLRTSMDEAIRRGEAFGSRGGRRQGLTLATRDRVANRLDHDLPLRLADLHLRLR